MVHAAEYPDKRGNIRRHTPAIRSAPAGACLTVGASPFTSAPLVGIVSTTSDVVDAALVLLAEDGDEIITSDPADLTVLTGHADLDVELYRLTRQSRLPKMRRKKKNTFSASRKIDAASSGAESRPCDRRSRWKSPIVSPAKTTSPMIA